MTNKTALQAQLTEQEIRLLELLRQQPEMAARFESILKLASNAEGPLKTADEVEALLIEEVRRLGHTTMSQWAVRAEQRVSQELKEQEPAVRSRKKTLTWWCVFRLVTVRERVWRTDSKSYLRPLPKRLGVMPRGRSRRLKRVLTDLGCEHSFARAAQSVREHYGFEVGASAVRQTTLEQAQRAQRDLEVKYEESFRVLPNRTDCLDDPRALALGLPIGSGMVESGHRHVLQARFKKAGAAWLKDHAEQMAQLRVLRANSKWESFWN